MQPWSKAAVISQNAGNEIVDQPGISHVMTTRSKHPLSLRMIALRHLRALALLTALIAFFLATILSARLGIDMARNRLATTSVLPTRTDTTSLPSGNTGDPLYLARSPEALRRFFSSHSTTTDRAAADLTGSGILRLRNVKTLKILHTDADVLQVEVSSESVAEGIFWIHHSQIPGASTFDPIISPIPTQGDEPQEDSQR